MYGQKGLHGQSGGHLERLLPCTPYSLFSFYFMAVEVEVFARHLIAHLRPHFPDSPAARCGHVSRPMGYLWKWCISFSGCTVKTKFTCVHSSLIFNSEMIFYFKFSLERSQLISKFFHSDLCCHSYLIWSSHYLLAHFGIVHYILKSALWPRPSGSCSLSVGMLLCSLSSLFKVITLYGIWPW